MSSTDKVIAVRNNKTVYRRGDTAVKVFGEDFSKADILNEALNQARRRTPKNSDHTPFVRSRAVSPISPIFSPPRLRSNVFATCCSKR